MSKAYSYQDLCRGGGHYVRKRRLKFDKRIKLKFDFFTVVKESWESFHLGIDNIAFNTNAMHFGRWGLPRQLNSLSK